MDDKKRKGVGVGRALAAEKKGRKRHDVTKHREARVARAKQPGHPPTEASNTKPPPDPDGQEKKNKKNRGFLPSPLSGAPLGVWGGGEKKEEKKSFPSSSPSDIKKTLTTPRTPPTLALLCHTSPTDDASPHAFEYIHNQHARAPPHRALHSLWLVFFFFFFTPLRLTADPWIC